MDRVKFRMTVESFITTKLFIRNEYIRHFLAEFLGTYVLIVIGIGANAQKTLGKGNYGDIFLVNWAWSVAVSMGVWTAGGITGGHLNPAVSLAMAALGRLSLRKMLVYWLAQYLSCFFAAACVYGIYYEALYEFDGGIRSVFGENATAGIWSTYPQPYLSIRSGFADQVFGTMLLLLCVAAVTDSKNSGAPNGVAPFFIGLIVFVIGLSFGFNCGYPLNPARDFAPRVFTAIAGWGCEVFSAYNYWFWIPIVAPHIGAVCGVVIYVLLVGLHLNQSNTYEVEAKTISLEEVNSSDKPVNSKMNPVVDAGRL